MKRILSFSLMVVCLLSLAGCKKGREVQVNATVTQDAKYNAALVSLSQEEFEKAGFCLGDSCDIEFGNGYKMTDVPYYNGYYVKTASPIIVAYPGYANVIITYNNQGIWNEAGLTENESVTVRLKEAKKFSAVQETLGQVYSFSYSDYDSSEQFCNFRPLSGGQLKTNFLYRGATPVDISRGRAPYTDKLLREAGINFVIDLADSEEEMENYLAGETFDSPYTAELYKNGQVILLDMDSSYQSENYRQKVADGMKAVLKTSGPVYIHCMEGKDRTGFVSMLLEALAGASYEEMCCDYMKTYENYYGVSEKETPEKYNAIIELYFDPFAACLHGTENVEELKSADYTQDAVNYLIAGGMTQEEVAQLQKTIMK